MTTTKFDICKYLCGDWKRCLEMREFGGIFQHVKTVNTLLHFEEVIRNDAKYLNWTIQKNDKKTTYEMKVVSLDEHEMTFSDVNQNLTGRYISSQKTLILTIASTTLWNITFRVVDENQMSLNMSQIDSSPVIMFGNVFRL